MRSQLEDSRHGGAQGARGSTEPSPRSVLAAYAQNYLLFGVMHGLDVDALCAQAGCSAADVSDRDRQIPYAWAHALQRALIEGLPGVDVGFQLGMLASFETLGYLGQALRNCETALNAIELYGRFARLLDSAYRQRPPRLRVAADSVETRWPILPPDPSACTEADFVGAVKLLRELQPALVVREARIGYGRDLAMQARLQAFFGCPVLFGADAHALVFERATLEQPCVQPNAIARGYIEGHLHKLIAGLEEPFVASVQRTVEALLSTDGAAQRRVAQRLGLSPRVLQRRLKQYGASYKTLVENQRRERALRLLQTGECAVYEVAFAVGYDDVSAFNRAFRRWTGCSPRAFRAARTDRGTEGS